MAKKTAANITVYDDDIVALAKQDRSTFEIIDALRQRYDVELSKYFVYTRLKAHPAEYQAWRANAQHRLYRRCSEARQKTSANSLAQRLKREGVPSRSYYNIREELVDAEVEHTPQDIIDIYHARQRHV